MGFTAPWNPSLILGSMATQVCKAYTEMWLNLAEALLTCISYSRIRHVEIYPRRLDRLCRMTTSESHLDMLFLLEHPHLQGTLFTVMLRIRIRQYCLWDLIENY